MSIVGLGVGFDKVRLANKRFSVNLTEAIVGEPRITRTIDGASTFEFTVSDPEGRLRREKFLTEATRIVVDDELRFVLVKVTKNGDDLTLTAEDEIVYLMRRKEGPKAVKRAKRTRAQFIKSLVKEAVGDRDVNFSSPELKEKQPIEDQPKPKTKASKPENSGRGPGIPLDARGLTVKGTTANKAQKRMADRLIRSAYRQYKNPPRRAVLALLCAATHESVMGTLGMNNPVDHDSVGVLQGRLMYNSRKDLLSVHYNVRRFMARPWTGTSLGGAIKQAKANRSIGDICTSIQGNATGDVYTQWKPEAEAWLRAYFGGDAGPPGGGTIEKTVLIPYQFEVEKGENYWEAAKRLADEVNWRLFVVGNTVYYSSEPTLLKGRRRLNIGANTKGVDQVDWDIDAGKKANTATVTARVKNWQAPPGTVVTLDESHGPAEGRWLVSEIDGTISQQEASISLKRVTKPKPEPPAETKTTTERVPDRTRRPSRGDSSTKALSRVRIKSFAPGEPYWGGTRPIFNQLITPWLERRFGLYAGSKKRTSTLGNPGSDHYIANTTAYAIDYPTTDGAKAANAVGRLLGRSGPSVGTFSTFNIKVQGQTFRVQILWAVENHYNHVHIGIRRA